MPEASRDRSFIRDQGARLLDRAAKAWVKVSELRRRADESANQARGAVSRRWNALRTRLAYRWMLWRACWASIARRRGVVAEARRRLWDELRANAPVRSYLNARWAPWWLGFARRFPVHCALLAAFVVLAVPIHLALFGAEPVICRREAGSCHEVLRSVVGVVLSAQAALLAVIFPVAVALVTLLGGNGLRRRERLQLFFADTELAIAGMSALLLAGTSTVVLTWGEHASPQLASIGASLCSVWFGLNLSGLGFFLWRGVRFLLPGGQDQALRRQVTSLYWPEEAAPKLADVMLSKALDPGANMWAERYQLWRSPATDERRTVSVTLTAPARLVEVQHPALGFVARALECRCPDTTDPRIVFHVPRPRAIGTPHDGSVTLAKATVPMTDMERWLIRRAYVFSSRAKSEPLTGDRLLTELVTDALDDLRGGNWPAFEDRIDTIAALHGFLLRLSSRRDPDGRRNSYAADLAGSWLDTVAGIWARRLIPLFTDVAARLPETRTVFEQVAYLPIHLAYEAGDTVPPAALIETDRRVAGLAYRLFEHGVEAAGLPLHQGGVAADPIGLPLTIHDWYDTAWITLSAAWERLTFDRTPRFREEAPPEARWTTCLEHWQALGAHLTFTTDLVAYAAALGELRGGRRALDLLLRWPFTLPEAGASTMSIAVEPGDVSPSVLEQADWLAVQSTVPLHAPEWPIEPQALFQAAVWNAWSDECLAVALTLIGWTRQAAAHSPAAELARCLIHRRIFDERSTPRSDPLVVDPFDPRWLLRTATGVVAETMRSPQAWRRLEDRIERLHRPTEGRLVPGRVYSGGGFSFRLVDETASFAPLLVAMALKHGQVGAWPTTPAALGLVDPSPSDEHVARFFDNVAETTEKLSDPASLELLRGLARSRDITDERIATVRSDVVRVCQTIARNLRDRRETGLREAEVDPHRLAAIANAAESHAFAKDVSGPPVSLFATVERMRGDQPLPFGVRMSHSRGSLTTPVLEQPVSNEAEWWAQTMRDHVAAIVCRHLIDRAGQHTQVESPETWRDTLIAWLDRIRVAGGIPVLLYGRDWPGRWARGDELGQAILERLNHTNPREWSRARTPFLDDVQIERLPVTGPTLVAPAFFFRRIVFGEGPDGRIVNADFTPSTNDPTHGALTSRGTFDLELDRPDLALVIETPASPD